MGKKFSWTKLFEKAAKEGGWVAVVAASMALATVETVRGAYPDLWLLEHDVVAVAILTGVYAGVIKGVRNLLAEKYGIYIGTERKPERFLP